MPPVTKYSRRNEECRASSNIKLQTSMHANALDASKAEATG